MASHPGEGGIARAEGLEALVVVAPPGEVGLGDDVGALVAEAVDPAHVVEVALGEDDGPGGSVVDGVEGPPVERSLEAHAGVDDDPTVVGLEEVTVRQPG